MRIIISAAGLLAVAMPAFAQKAGVVAADLRKNVACAAPAARSGLEAAIGRSTALAADIDLALKAISDDTAICSPQRDAALAIASARSSRAGAPETSPSLSNPLAPTSREAVAAALAEAERQANNLKFEVGPPPPTITKGRNSGL
jgi:hypothetical protein